MPTTAAAVTASVAAGRRLGLPIDDPVVVADGYSVRVRLGLVVTPEGPRWTDFEDVCVGPVEWDLASYTVTDEAVAAYPGPVDHARLADCRDLRRLQILAGVLTDGVQDPGLYEGLVEALRLRLG